MAEIVSQIASHVLGAQRKVDMGRVSQKIRKLRHEGKPRDQAVAIAHSMMRSGRLGPKGGYRKA